MIDLFTDCSALGLRESSQRLLYWLGIALDAKRVFREFSWYSGHVGRTPGENLPLCSKEGHEGGCLLLREVGVYADCLLRVRWVNLVGDCVTVDAEVAAEFL